MPYCVTPRLFLKAEEMPSFFKQNSYPYHIIRQIGKFAECAGDLSFVQIAYAAVFVSLNNSSIVSFCCLMKISRLEPRLKFKVRCREIGRARQTFQSGHITQAAKVKDLSQDNAFLPSNNTTSNDRIPFILTYHPFNNNVKDIIDSNFKFSPMTQI